MNYDDWYLNLSVFALLTSIWGPHTVDRFADYHNCQLPRFNSRCWSPGLEAVDTSTTNWSAESNWWCPPVALIPRVITHVQACGARGTLIVPEWQTPPFWAVLHSTLERFADFVLEIQELPKSKFLILPGPSGNTLFKGKSPNTKVLALRSDFTVQAV